MPCTKHGYTACFCPACDLDVIAGEERLQQERFELKAALETNGYFNLRWFGNVCVGLHQYLTTCGIVVGLDESSYERRYCYQDRAEAARILEEWDGVQHPGGNWIKLKGRFDGQPVDMLNPNWRAT
jgi:hypothetical protein